MAQFALRPVDLASARGACANCGAELTGPFCSACGQERDVHRRTVWFLIAEAVRTITNWDGRLLQTVRALLLRPGELSLAFREGRTQRYLPAPRLYLFVSLLFFVLLSASDIALMQLEVTVSDRSATEGVQEGLAKLLPPAASGGDAADLAETRREIVLAMQRSGAADLPAFNTTTHFFSRIGSVHSSVTPEQRARLERADAQIATAIKSNSGRWTNARILQGLEVTARNPAALNQPLTAWIPRVLFLLLPLFALLLCLFHIRRRKEFLFVDHMVFSLNFHSFAFVVLIFAAFAVQRFSAGIVGWTTLAAVLGYGYLAMKRFYGQSYIRTGVKFVSIAFLYTVFFLMPALGIVLLASMTEV